MRINRPHVNRKNIMSHNIIEILNSLNSTFFRLWSFHLFLYSVKNKVESIESKLFPSKKLEQRIAKYGKAIRININTQRKRKSYEKILDFVRRILLEKLVHLVIILISPSNPWNRTATSHPNRVRLILHVILKNILTLPSEPQNLFNQIILRG